MGILGNRTFGKKQAEPAQPRLLTRIVGMQRDAQDIQCRLNRARATVDEIERLCARSALLTARAEELLFQLRQHRSDSDGLPLFFNHK